MSISIPDVIMDSERKYTNLYSVSICFIHQQKSFTCKICFNLCLFRSSKFTPILEELFPENLLLPPLYSQPLGAKVSEQMQYAVLLSAHCVLQIFYAVASSRLHQVLCLNVSLAENRMRNEGAPASALTCRFP